MFGHFRRQPVSDSRVRWDRFGTHERSNVFVYQVVPSAVRVRDDRFDAPDQVRHLVAQEPNFLDDIAGKRRNGDRRNHQHRCFDG